MQGWGKREISEKTRRPATLSGTIPTCENLGVSRLRELMRVIEVSMKQHRNERVGETGYPRENPPTNGIVRHDSHMRKSGDPPATQGWGETGDPRENPPTSGMIPTCENPGVTPPR
ncbi:hypothetical protein PR048_002680 [Dryococelus australis]|uniref:Uncharacterized protein n=1 Tax=Dryococelus australis TaxID=614101 RepID=A0ABQ9IKV9_9NEOP|nr:hypothetical protein PR048_002680 [Dryococelus australis]